MAATTDQQATAERPAGNRRSRGHALTVLYATGALFVIAMALLVYRMEAGLDPAIGAAVKKPEPVQRTLIVKRKVVEVIDPAPNPSTAGAAPVAPAPGQYYVAPAPTQSYVAPAPAPAPATRAS